MIQGTIGDDDELFFEIDLIANDGLELTVDALLDTGFSGWLAIDEQEIEYLNWQLLGNRNMYTARGEAKFNIYAGKIKIQEQEFNIPVHVGSGLTEFLLGRKWLKSRRLLVDIPSGILTLYEQHS